MTMWMVRAERGGVLFSDFIDRGLVAIGWSEVGDLSPLKTRAQIAERVTRAYPAENRYSYGKSTGTLFRFAWEMKREDYVITYDRSRRIYEVGRITGNYEFSDDPIKSEALEQSYPQVRTVKWQGEVLRDKLLLATRNSLGSIMTLFRLPEHAEADILRALAGKPALPESSADETTSGEAAEDVAVEQENSSLENIEAQGLELAMDIVAALDWKEMQELVAGLLRAMGYKTRVSPAGADRGKDIIASPDGFGFEVPRIVVEVKHRKGTMAAPDIRSFLGGRIAGDKGLYVSTGGFTKDARYEADRASIPLMLMALEDLVQALIEHYPDLDLETRRLMPLKPVYWPIG